MGEICRTSGVCEIIDARTMTSDSGGVEWKHQVLIMDSLRDEGHTLELVYEAGVEERHRSRRRSRGCMVEPCVTSSSSYSKSLEIKAGNSEVRRVPGNGFSSCAAPTFSRVQGISNGGRNRFPECAGMESVPEQFRVRVQRREKRRFGVRIVRRCVECAR